MPEVIAPRRLFLPTARQTNWLLVIRFLSLGEALYLRYQAMENGKVSIACRGGLGTWLCGTFRLAIVLYNHQVLAASRSPRATQSLRPSLILFAWHSLRRLRRGHA